MHDVTRRIATIGVAAVLASGLAGGAIAQDTAALYEAAKKEGEVNWYTGLIQNQIVRPIVAAFEAKYPGVKVRVSGGLQNDLVLKVLAESKAGSVQADLIDGNAIVGPLKQGGVIQPYKSASTAKLPADYKDADGLWAGLLLYFLVPAVNTENVKAADEPKTLNDLLDPKWKGKLAWTGEMQPGGPPGFIGAILTSMGEKEGMDYLKKLATQQIRTVPSNPRVVLDQVIAGQYPMALVTYNHHSVISAAKGAPTKWLPVNPAVGSISTLVLLAKSPHPNAGKLLYEFLMSPDGGKVIQEAEYIPANPEVPAKTATLKPEVGNFKAVMITPEMAEKSLDSWIKVYNELFK
jgi:ABC-type Fe3+ transport system substrate-binding protein